ncbi:hypothetical protein MRX96_040161 [Rhipicephalus microplus]
MKLESTQVCGETHRVPGRGRRRRELDVPLFAAGSAVSRDHTVSEHVERRNGITITQRRRCRRLTIHADRLAAAPLAAKTASLEGKLCLEQREHKKCRSPRISPQRRIAPLVLMTASVLSYRATISSVSRMAEYF